MTLIKIVFSILFILNFCTSCADTKNNVIILGTWQATSWENNGEQLPRNVNTTFFTFTDKGEYSFENNGSIEKGTYKVENNNLFTTATGKQEIMVKIMKATSDSLIFDMNNGGQQETITLLKKK